MLPLLQGKKSLLIERILSYSNNYVVVVTDSFATENEVHRKHAYLFAYLKQSGVNTRPVADRICLRTMN